MPNRQDPFDPGDPARYRPPDARTQKELGGVLERAFERESGVEPNEEENRRYHALADEALREAEIRLALAREAEAALAEAEDPEEVRKWTETLETYRREAGELRLEAERLRQYVA